MLLKILIVLIIIIVIILLYFTKPKPIEQPKVLTNYLIKGDLFESIKIYRFDENLKNVRKARILTNHIIKHGTPVQREKARMILKEIQIEDNIDNEIRKKEEKMNKMKMNEMRMREPPSVNERQLTADDFIFQQMLQNNDILLRKQYETQNINRLKEQEEINEEIRIIEEVVFNHLPVELKENDDIKNDTQNVHDSDVVRSVKAGLLNISNGNTNDRWDIDVKNIVFSNKKAYDTYMKMIGNNKVISAYAMSEKDVLKNVWSRINDPVNNDIRLDMIKILEKQLEDGYNVCEMGRCTRVLQTLEATDRANIVKIKPEWAIKEEMLHTSSNLYKNMMDKLEDKSILSKDEDELDENEKFKFNNFKNEYRNTLLEIFQKDYQDTLSNDFLKVKVDEMVNAF